MMNILINNKPAIMLHTNFKAMIGRTKVPASININKESVDIA